ncbi:MAG: ABC transporter permease [Armatimonadota bacterium]|nr:ABC transporter permease [Armatimonadota bacterium]
MNGIAAEQAAAEPIRTRRDALKRIAFRRRAVLYPVARALSVLVLLLAWEGAGRRAAGSFTLPPVTAVAAALAGQLADPRFWSAAAVTLQALFVGFALTMAVGIPAGLIVGRVPVVGRLVNPYLQFLLAVPASPLVPLFVIVFGIGLAARVATVVTFGVAILIVNTAAGVRLTPPSLVQMAESFGAAPVQVFRRVVLPAALPGIAAGLRLAAGRAVVGMVVSELIIISVGLGRLISQYSATFDAANLYAVVIVILSIGVAVARGMSEVERRAVRWR